MQELNYKIKVTDTHCNACGNLLSGQDKINNTALRERLGAQCRLEDEEHRVFWCGSCFDALITSCVRPTQVSEFMDTENVNYRFNDDDPYAPVPNAAGHEHCNICGSGLNGIELSNTRLVIQAIVDGQKHQIRFCYKCFEKLVESLVRPSFLQYWGNFSHIETE